MRQWWYSKDQQKIGPVPEEALLGLIATGEVKPSTWMWSDGQTEWLPAAQISAFKDAIAAAPTDVLLRAELEEVLPAAPPWARLWARLLDNLIWSTVLGLAVGVAIGLFAPHLAERVTGRAPQFAIGIALLLPAMVLLDAACMAVMGTTPGKSLAGIRVRHQGRRLNFSQAMRRNFMIWWRGLACGVPLISLLTIVQAESELREKGATAWDVACQTEVTGKPAAWRVLVTGALVICGYVLARLG